MSQALWQKWQGEIGEALQASPIYYLRLYDTRSTRAKSYLPKQPADHLCISRGHGFLVEDKTSEKMETAEACYASGIFDDTQIAKHRIWMKRGGTAFFTVYLQRLDRAELWASEDLVTRQTEGRRLFHVEHPDGIQRVGGPLFISENKKTLALHAQSLVQHALSIVNAKVKG